ncbi:hypothetical protein BGX27_001646 [Mortierella sp. AM989]|nr:hypothetical protein BGX27_001646 [Mortierella sp. AM989]
MLSTKRIKIAHGGLLSGHIVNNEDQHAVAHFIQDTIYSLVTEPSPQQPAVIIVTGFAVGGNNGEFHDTYHMMTSEPEPNHPDSDNNIDDDTNGNQDLSAASELELDNTDDGAIDNDTGGVEPQIDIEL